MEDILVQDSQTVLILVMMWKARLNSLLTPNTDSQKGGKKDQEGLELWTRNQFQFGEKSIQTEKKRKRTTSQSLEADHLTWPPFHTFQSRQRAAPKNIQLPVLAYKGIYEDISRNILEGYNQKEGYSKTTLLLCNIVRKLLTSCNTLPQDTCKKLLKSKT